MRKDSGPGILLILVGIGLALLLILFIAGLILLPQIIQKFSPYLSKLGELKEPNQTQPPSQLNSDMAKYYSLKNLSCKTLSGDFLIVTDDYSSGSVVGLLAKIPQENDVARSIASSNDYNQTTKTYVRDSEMKKVIISGKNNLTAIWKDGRLYDCASGCTMKILGDQGWQAYLDSLKAIRIGCAYFGKTPMPDSVNMSRLLSIQYTGRQNVNGFQCENFLISGNSSYAKDVIANYTLNDDQRAILWMIQHQAAPMDECLDDGVGIVVFRSVNLDISKSYNFEYAPGGGMFLAQQTKLTYFSANVPEQFMALPS